MVLFSFQRNWILNKGWERDGDSEEGSFLLNFMKNGLSHCRWPSGSSSQFKQTVALLEAKRHSYLGSRLKQTVARLTANTDSYLNSKTAKSKSSGCGNQEEYSLAKLQTARKDLQTLQRVCGGERQGEMR